MKIVQDKLHCYLRVKSLSLQIQLHNRDSMCTSIEHSALQCVEHYGAFNTNIDEQAHAFHSLHSLTLKISIICRDG